MKWLGTQVQQFVADELGPEIVEWVMVTVILVAATYAIMMAIGGELKRLYTDLLGMLQGIGVQ